jgi:hypothetical protein
MACPVHSSLGERSRVLLHRQQRALQEEQGRKKDADLIPLDK